MTNPLLAEPFPIEVATIRSRSFIDPREQAVHVMSVRLRPLSLLLTLSYATASAEIDRELTLGIETLSGLRSSYIDRGFKLAESTLEFQVESEVALGEGFSIPLAAWTIAESGGDFSENAFSIGLQKDWEDFQISTFLDYRLFENSVFEDGFDLGLAAKWFLSDDWDLGAEARYNVAAEGSYFALEAGYSKPLNEDFFLSAEGGVSATASYFDRSGLNDLYGRLSLTYNVNSFLSLSPFVGFSIALDDDADDEGYAGVWLAVSF